MKPLDKKAKEHVNDLTPLLDVSFMDKEECVNYKAELSYKAGYLEGRQDALRECVDLIVEHKNYHVDMVEDGYNNYANLIELCGSFIEEIQNLMQQFNNEGEMKCRKS